MNSNKKIAVSVGILILVAYSLLGSNNPEMKTLGMFLEVISGLAVVGIAALMFPLLKPYNKNISIGYALLKWIEGLMMIVGGILFLSFNTELLNLRDDMYLVHAYVFGLSALAFYYLLYKSKLIPEWLSIWGAIASVLVMIANVLVQVGFEEEKLIPLFLPIVINEVVLAIWLMVKGFNLSAIRLEK